MRPNDISPTHTQFLSFSLSLLPKFSRFFSIDRKDASVDVIIDFITEPATRRIIHVLQLILWQRGRQLFLLAIIVNVQQQQQRADVQLGPLTLFFELCRQQLQIHQSLGVGYKRLFRVLQTPHIVDSNQFFAVQVN
jgi:hypothetical protein